MKTKNLVLMSLLVAVGAALVFNYSRHMVKE